MHNPLLELFTHRRMVEDLVAGFLLCGREELEWMDFADMAQVPESWVPDGPRYAEATWSIPFRPQGGPREERVYILLLVKVLDVAPADVAERMDRHAASLWREILRRQAFGAPARPPQLMPIVLYGGAETWRPPEADFILKLEGSFVIAVRRP